MTIRDLRPHEQQTLALGACPLCRRDRFQPGPRGGAAQNFECVACGRRYNITLYGGMVIFAQFIGQRPLVDDWARYREQCAACTLREFVEAERRKLS